MGMRRSAPITLVSIALVQGFGFESKGQAKTSAPTATQAAAFAAQLDQALDQGHPDEFLEAFALGDRPRFDRELRSRLSTILRIAKLRTHSKVLEYFVREKVGIALITTEYSCPAGKQEVATFNALRQDGDRTIGLFSIEVDPDRAKSMADHRGRFACPACNYEICFGPEWLAVPVRPGRSGCMESMWLVSLRHDLHFEAAVHIGDRAVDARAAMRACVRSSAGEIQRRSEGEPKLLPWFPGSYKSADSLPAGMSSIRCVEHCPAGQVADMHLIVMGRLRYLFVVRGSEATIAAHREPIDRVLQSFRLLHPEMTAKQMLLQATAIHTGRGVLGQDNRYLNQTYRVSFTGPEGWNGRVVAGAWLFRVEFECPHETGLLSVEGVQPIGRGWTVAAADALIEASLAEGDRHLIEDRGWSKAATGGFRWRELRTAGKGKETADGLVHYAMREDLLVVVRGVWPAPVLRTAVETAAGTLRTPR